MALDISIKIFVIYIIIQKYEKMAMHFIKKT